MFKFGFSSDDVETEEHVANIDEENLKWYKSEEFRPNADDTLVKKILGSEKVNIIRTNHVDIQYLCSAEVLGLLRQEQTVEEIGALRAEESHSDLLPAIYEGGLKIWECTYDLLHYIDSSLVFENKNVLDLGCGAGILGIFTVLKNSCCYFQDYNSDVIRYLTIPNVLLNAKDSIKKCRFYSGDWQSFSELLEIGITDENKFDYIFTSETIYNTENYTKLHRVFEKLLKKCGIIFLAAKSFYFGVGGGISMFKDFLDRKKIFKHCSVWTCEEGIKREILKIELIA